MLKSIKLAQAIDEAAGGDRWDIAQQYIVSDREAVLEWVANQFVDESPTANFIRSLKQELPR